MALAQPVGYGKDERRPTGDYKKLSRFLGSSPPLTIFRRFGDLNVQNILLLQAELAYLEGTDEQSRFPSAMNDQFGKVGVSLSCTRGRRHLIEVSNRSFS